MEVKARKAKIERKTNETSIQVAVNLDGKGKSKIDTGIGFFNHMLELLSKHSLIDLKVSAKGDLNVDQHHTIEDVAIILGKAIDKALASKKGTARYGWQYVPMDESLAFCAIDLSGRPYLKMEAKLKDETIEEFFKALANEMKANIHLKLVYGKNEHHKTEALFKAFARALREAVGFDKRQKWIPSTKGRL
ncbi:MAG: imidazoleglycerol-phosphate dehydratase HisB [Candidatus Diapherotrites archaeon]